MTGAEADEATPESAADSTAYPLPDIKQVLKKKEIEEEQARIEEEKEASIPKIKRSDKKALVKVRNIWSDELFFPCRKLTTTTFF
jgi:hypothetical protein